MIIYIGFVTITQLAVDPVSDVRFRSLRELTSILKNNILFANKDLSGENDSISAVSLEVLVRNLIRMFQFRPVLHEDEVLDLLILTLSRRDFLRNVAKYISVSRMKKEIVKIGNLVVADESFIKLQTISQLLIDYEASILIECANTTGSFSDVASLQYSHMPPDTENTLLERTKRVVTSSSSVISKCINDEMFSWEFWEKLDGVNLDTFNGIHAKLSLFKEADHLRNMLNFLRVSADDYPAEFFLQPPKVLKSLIDIFYGVANEPRLQIVKLIRFIINGLKDRYLESPELAGMQNQNLSSIKEHLHIIMTMLTDYFKKVHDGFNPEFFMENQNVLHEVYLLVFDICEFIRRTQKAFEIHIDELLNVIGNIAKDLRLFYATADDIKRKIRLQYIVCIYIINALVSSVGTNSIRAHSNTDIWQFECDVALLDVPLKIAHSKIYSLILLNRQDVVKVDEDLSMVLNCQKLFKPVVEIYQNWENMSSEAIVLIGVKAIDTIRIHQSLELVNLLMMAIQRCSRDSENLELKLAAEEIFLRLISIDVPEVRRRVYTVTCKSIQKKIEDASGDMELSASLCWTIGMPISTEIITEILCFGFTDSDTELKQNARQILFALLRSKVIFKNSWQSILNLMKPVLPLMTCMMSIDEKMGFFVFDVYHQHSGFEEDELNEAFARFLFCSSPKARVMAKTKLLQNLELDQELIEVVPNDFCLVPEPSVTNLQIPVSTLGYDEKIYAMTHEVLKTMDRSDDGLVQSVLLQLSVLMNSKAMCQKSHDDNVWVYLMAPLDMGFPEHKVIRKLSIDILLKWTLCVPTFRIYLANEPKVLKFLVKTLIFFQDDENIKKQASLLMFLLLFNDFIVATEKVVSTPQFFSNLNCPFKSKHHWTESPFNQITNFERFFEELETNQESADIREVLNKCLKFTFALEWFKTERALVEMQNFTSDSYNEGLSSKTIQVGDNLQLTQSDFACVQQSVNMQIPKTICRQLENPTMVLHADDLIYETQVLLTVPVVDEEVFAEMVDKRIDHFMVNSVANAQQNMFIGCLQIYQQIMKNLRDERIVNFCNKKFISCIIMSNASFSEEVYIEGLNVIDCVVKLCLNRPSLMDLLIKTFDREHKVYLPSRIVENLTQHLFSEVMKDGKWHQAGNRPIVKSILNVMRNVLSIMPTQLDDAYLHILYDKLVVILLPLYRSHFNHIKAATSLHVHSSMMKIIFAILLSIASLIKHQQLKPDHYKSLNFWSFEETRKYKALPLMIIVELTKEKEHYEVFVKGFSEVTGTKLVDVVCAAFLRPTKNSNASILDQKVLVSLMANILEHDSLGESGSTYARLMIKKLIECENLSALAFITTKIIQIEFPNTFDIIVQHEIIKKLLGYQISERVEPKAYQLIAELLEAITVCFMYMPLRDHVIDIIMSQTNAKFMTMLLDSKVLNNKVFKRFNINAFNMLKIMMYSEVGLMRICQAMNEPTVIDRMMYASHDNLRITNHHNDIISQLGFWNWSLDSSTNFGSPFIDLISSHKVDVATGDFILNPDSDDKNKQKFDTILEKNFGSVIFAVDLLFLQVVSIFEFVGSSMFSSEKKHEIKALCFLIIKKLTATNDRVKQLSVEIKLISILTGKFEFLLAVMQNFRHLETTKKKGVPVCHFMIKSLCLLIKALTEWKLQLNNHTHVVKNLFFKLQKVSDWLYTDSVLINCFMNFLQVMSKMDIGRSCLMEEVEGKPLISIILKKTQAFSVKPPHTETNLALMRNGLTTLKSFSQFIEVRMFLKNAKVFQTFEVLHPQIQKNRETTWDKVTLEWLKFFEFLSRFDDTECLPNEVSLLCRLFRLGNQEIKKQSLVIIRNLSSKTSIGQVLLNSEDFKQTVDLILMGSGGSCEKILILQTLLSIASKAEQLKAKLKNSSLNRKLKEQLMVMKSDAQLQSNPENEKIFNLTSMLSQRLYS